MIWALVRRNGIAGLIPPPSHYHEQMIRDAGADLAACNKRARPQRKKGVVDLTLDYLFVDHFLPLTHIERLSKWFNFWHPNETQARHFGYTIFSNGGASRHYNPLPPRLVDERDHPLIDHDENLVRWIKELQRHWNWSIRNTLPTIDLNNIPVG